MLDATAARLTKNGAVRANFRATQFRGITPQEETSGTMLLDGRKFQMQTPDMMLWFDGKQQWAMQRDASEVNLTEPTEEEVASVNPAMIVGIYKNGYTATLSRSTLRGRNTYVVHLRATSAKAEFSDIYIDTERDTFTPLCIRACQNGDWVRLSILSFQDGQKTSSSDFTFPKKDYPKVEVIDLR